MMNLEDRTVAISRQTSASIADVWGVLSDGWLYPLWVVGASRMRSVDAGWPEVGTRLHHSVGNWPVLIDDETEVLEVRPLQLLRLKAHAWPAGAAEVFIKVESADEGALVTIREDASDGPGTLVPRIARQAAIAPRNREALRRLAFVAEGRGAGGSMP